MKWALPNIKSKNRQLLLLGMLVLVLIPFKDLLDSSLNNYGFYLSESLLFGSFWLLFIPGILLHINLMDRIQHKTGSLIVLIPLVFLHITFFSLLVYVISDLWFNHTFGFTRVFSSTVSGNGFVAFLIYIVTWFLAHRSTLSQVPESTGSYPKRIPVTRGHRTHFIATEDIQYVCSDKPYICLVTSEGKHLVKNTLSGFLDNYNSGDFVRVHRSNVVNLLHVLSYSSRKNGDYDLQMRDGSSVRMSRTYSPEFKAKFR